MLCNISLPASYLALSDGSPTLLVFNLPAKKMDTGVIGTNVWSTRPSPVGSDDKEDSYLARDFAVLVFTADQWRNKMPVVLLWRRSRHPFLTSTVLQKEQTYPSTDHHTSRDGPKMVHAWSKECLPKIESWSDWIHVEVQSVSVTGNLNVRSVAFMTAADKSCRSHLHEISHSDRYDCTYVLSKLVFFFN